MPVRSCARGGEMVYKTGVTVPYGTCPLSPVSPFDIEPHSHMVFMLPYRATVCAIYARPSLPVVPLIPLFVLFELFLYTTYSIVKNFFRTSQNTIDPMAMRNANGDWC